VTVSVRDALESDLSGMPEAVQRSTLAAVARELATVMDSTPGARDAASVAKEMRAALADLKVMAEAVPEESDPIDELSRRRADRESTPAVPNRSGGDGRQLGP
jgi:hypothetical protein